MQPVIGVAASGAKPEKIRAGFGSARVAFALD
jgi:hypothetical protein